MDDGPNLLVRLFPLEVLGLLVAVVVYAIARRRRVRPWGWTLATLIPVLGLVVAGVFLVRSLLSILDRLEALEAGRRE
jgi:hypothetical protein